MVALFAFCLSERVEIYLSGENLVQQLLVIIHGLGDGEGETLWVWVLLYYRYA